MTPYGEAYHAYASYEPSSHLGFEVDLDLSNRYWVTDVTKLNPHFGNAGDLQALSKAVHDRGMRVDYVQSGNLDADLFWQVAHGRSVASLSAQNLTFKTQSSYHPLCWIDYNSQDSIERCWMGDGKVPLMDLNTENFQVQNTLNNMIRDLVTTYRIDGLRIDGE
jgi:alpha-amylase